MSKGLDQAFEILADQHREMLVTYVMGIVRDFHLAEDLVQETFAAARCRGQVLQCNILSDRKYLTTRVRRSAA